MLRIVPTGRAMTAPAARRTIRDVLIPSAAGSLATRFFGSTGAFPVSNQSTDFPNSRLMARESPGQDQRASDPVFRDLKRPTPTLENAPCASRDSIFGERLRNSRQGTAGPIRRVTHEMVENQVVLTICWLSIHQLFMLDASGSPNIW